MEGPRKFNRAEPTPKIPDGNLSPKRQLDLRYALAAVGALGVGGVAVGAYVDYNKKNSNRLEVLGTTGNAEVSQESNIIVNETGESFTNNNLPEQTERPVQSSPSKLRKAIEAAVQEANPEKTKLVQSIESQNAETAWGLDSEAFRQRVDGFEAWWTLQNGYYQLVDKETGVPIDEPVEPGEVIVDKRDKLTVLDSQYDPNAYRLTSDEPRSWLKFAANQRGLKDGTWEQLNVNADFIAALKNKDEPELAEGIQAGAIKTNIDIVGYFGMNQDRTVPGDSENRTYAQYVLDEMPQWLDIDDSLVKAEIMRLILGLIAKESRFNDGMDKNFATAWGALQLTDDVREEHLFKYNSALSAEENEEFRQTVVNKKLTFQEQVEIAGKHFSNIYKRLPHWIENGYQNRETYDRPEEVLATFKSLYASEEDWVRFGLVPFMINAYNGGSLLMGDAIEAYMVSRGDSLQTEWKNVRGYDLYYAVSKFAHESNEGRLANYGDDSVSYVPMTLAAIAAIAREYPELTGSDQIQLAQN